MSGIRRGFAAAALAALLALLAAAPAGAVPPNEVAIARQLKQLGVLPPYTNAQTGRAAVAAVVGAPERERSGPPFAVDEQRRTSLAEHLRARQAGRAAAATYTATALVILAEFGDEPWPAGSPTPTGPTLPGPAHGAIPAPLPGDNATFWPGDFSAEHFREMLFGPFFPIYDSTGILRGRSPDTLRAYFLEQSHGAYTVDGTVTPWVKLDLPESWYGADTLDGDHDVLTGPRWRFARDAVLALAAQNPDFDWARYDRENPWGITGKDFNQPDGYIDHLIVVHAGVDQSAGGGLEGSDALWSHSGFILDTETGGPDNGPGVLIPGSEGQGPGGKGIWAGAYTVDPEDGASPVFAHELGHDLGLDDQYDYSWDNPTGDTGSAFWTLMADGAWLGHEWGIGSTPGPFNVDDKATLGFITPKVVARGKTATVTLQRASTGSPRATGVKLPLPRASHLVKLSGKDGEPEWYSGRGNNLETTLATKLPVEVPAGGSLTFRTWYDIEQDYDFGHVEVSADGGVTWDTLRSFTGSDTDHWLLATWVDLSAYAGTSILVRFRYVTDGLVSGRGWEIADVGVGGSQLPRSAFTTDWLTADGSWVFTSQRYYIAEYRAGKGFDEALRHCHEADWDGDNLVDWFSYNRGVHLIYRDTFWDDNDVATHPGKGARMVVDARPKPDSVVYDGVRGYWRPRIQVRDAAFSRSATAAQPIYFIDYREWAGIGTRKAPAEAAQPCFQDTRTYWYAADPYTGVKLPKLGVRIQVQKVTATNVTLWVDNKP